MQTHSDLAGELGGINNAGSLAQLQFTFNPYKSNIYN